MVIDSDKEEMWRRYKEKIQEIYYEIKRIEQSSTISREEVLLLIKDISIDEINKCMYGIIDSSFKLREIREGGIGYEQQ